MLPPKFVLMSIFPRWTKLNSAFAVSLLAVAAAYAQVPGTGGPAGMSAAITKLFGDIKAFTAKAEVQVLDSSQQEVVSMPMDFALLDKSIRVEMDLSQMKNKQMPPGVADSLKQMGMAHVISIISPSKKSAFVVYPDQKSLLTMPLPKEDADSSKTPKVEKTALGKETIDGHACVKNKVVITDEKGEKVDATTWNASDLKDFPIQIQTKETENTSIVKFKQVQFNTPDAAQFEPPTGYTQYNNQQELMQGIMKKVMQSQGAEKK
jgi:hypothetical protein